jgi:hypothetical protein
MYFSDEVINDIKSLEHICFKIKYTDNLLLKYIVFNKKIYRSYYLVLYNKNKKYLKSIKYKDKNEVKHLVVFINNNSYRITN